MIANDVDKITYGDLDVSRVFVGDKLIFPRIPSNYILCEYLEGTNKYIKTDCIVTADIKVVVKFASSITHQGAIVGGRQGSWMDMSFWSDGYMHFGNASNQITNVYYDTNVHTAEISKNGIFVDAQRINGVSIGTNFSNTYNLYIFATNNDTTIDTRYFHGKIYSCKIYTNGVKEFDGIPCLDDTGKPCMYDLISKKTYYNLGTGDFGYKAINGSPVQPY